MLSDKYQDSQISYKIFKKRGCLPEWKLPLFIPAPVEKQDSKF